MRVLRLQMGLTQLLVVEIANGEGDGHSHKAVNHEILVKPVVVLRRPRWRHEANQDLIVDMRCRK